MKVHPVPKMLQRLPHVFDKVLQLPIRTDTEIAIQETSDSFLFTAAADDPSADVRVHAIKIHPGLVKVVVVRGLMGGGGDRDLDEDLLLWRFRLPASTRPEMATAMCCNGELVVIVPKNVNFEETGGVNCGNE